MNGLQCFYNVELGEILNHTLVISMPSKLFLLLGLTHSYQHMFLLHVYM